MTFFHAGFNSLTCYPECLSSVTSTDLVSYVMGCPTIEEDALCGLVAATSVADFHSVYGCNTTGFPNSAPCGWPGITCSGGVVVAVDVGSLGISGKCTSWEQSSSFVCSYGYIIL